MRLFHPPCVWGFGRGKVRPLTAWGCVTLLLTMASLGNAQATRRETADWQADLINVLQANQLHATAESICQRHYSDATATSDEAARWAIRWCRVKISAALAGEDDQSLSAAAEPIDQLLRAYPDHPRRVWLQTQRLMVEVSRLKRTALRVAITPGRNDLRDAGLRTSLDALKQIDVVLEELDEAAPRRDTELEVLRRNLQQQRVEIYLAQGQLFAPESADAVAAATSAGKAAEEVLGLIPTNSALGATMLRLLAKSQLATGRPDEALQTLDRLRAKTLRAWSPEAEALAIEALLAEGGREAAEQRLDAFYGQSPVTAPTATAMDLVRLKYLIALQADQQATTEQIADWVDAIEQRGGLYVRRRAEAIALGSSPRNERRGDTRLMVAEAAKQMRSGKPRDAAELLRRAAKMETDDGKALRHAAQSAAVFKSIQSPIQAVEVLTETALQHRAHPQAAQTHLQAAWLEAKQATAANGSDTATLEGILETTLSVWPDSCAAGQATTWLKRLLVAKQEYESAARLLLESPGEKTDAQLTEARQLWQAALRRQEDPASLLDEAIGSFGTSEAADSPQQAHRQVQQRLLQLLFADPPALSSQRVPTAGAGRLEMLNEAIAFRRGRRTAEQWDVDRLVEQLDLRREDLEDVVTRLFADGRRDPRDRPRLAAILQQLLAHERLADSEDGALADDDAASLRQARMLAWSGDWQAAQRLLQPRLDAAPRDLALWRRAAMALAESQDPAGRQVAIDWYAKLAAGLPQGSPSWHACKLATIDLHLQNSQLQQAAKLARYILLTRQPEDSRTGAAYERRLRQATGQAE